MHIINNRLFR